MGIFIFYFHPHPANLIRSFTKKYCPLFKEHRVRYLVVTASKEAGSQRKAEIYITACHTDMIIQRILGKQTEQVNINIPRAIYIHSTLVFYLCLVHLRELSEDSASKQVLFLWRGI